MRWFAISLSIAIAFTPLTAIAESIGAEDSAAILYDDLNEAVVAEEWQRAIATIDQLIADDPVRAAGLGGYRELLVAHANAQTDNVPTLPVLDSELTETARADRDIDTDLDRAVDSEQPAENSEQRDRQISNEPEGAIDSEKPTENSENRDREIERRVVRAGDRIGRRYSRDYREARFWVNLFRE